MSIIILCSKALIISSDICFIFSLLLMTINKHCLICDDMLNLVAGLSLCGLTA